MVASPNEWKTGSVQALLKSPDKDTRDASSYHPICLFPLLGKTSECLLPILTHLDFTSSRQYSFRRGRPAEDAYDTHRIIDQHPDQYIIGTLFDTTAAFDNLWWPSIFEELSYRHCPRDLAVLVAG